MPSEPTIGDLLKQRVSDYAVMFGSEQGKRILEEWRISVGERSSHTPGDPYQTAFKEGERSSYLRVLYYLKLAKNPRRMAQLLEENPTQEEI